MQTLILPTAVPIIRSAVVVGVVVATILAGDQSAHSAVPPRQGVHEASDQLSQRGCDRAVP